MRISLDENHFPDLDIYDTIGMAKICISRHVLGISYDVEGLPCIHFNPEIFEITLHEIESYIHEFTDYFLGYNKDLFFPPKLKPETALSVAKIIYESGLLEVPELYDRRF